MLSGQEGRTPLRRLLRSLRHERFALYRGGLFATFCRAPCSPTTRAASLRAFFNGLLGAARLAVLAKVRREVGLAQERHLLALRNSVLRGAPFGDEKWVDRTARQLGLESTLRPRGRAKKVEK